MVSTCREPSARDLTIDFYHHRQGNEDDIQEDSNLTFVENIFAAARTAPTPTGGALKLQERKIAIIKESQPDAINYLLIGGGSAAFAFVTSGIGAAIVSAICSLSLFKWMNGCSVDEQSAFVKAYVKANPRTSETELDQALVKYVEIQALNIANEW